MTRCVKLGAALAMAVVLLGCAPTDPAPTTTTDAPPTTREPAPECAIERRMIKTAVEAYRANGTHYPDSLADLVPEWLERPPTFEWTYTSNGTTYTLAGPC